MTDADVDVFAREMLQTKRGIGMSPPFYAETASAKGDQSWPYWIVRNTYCNSLGRFLPKELAERFAAAMNKVSAKMGKTGGGLSAPQAETEEYYILPEDAFQFLPEEWRNHFQAMADDQRAILNSADSELSQLVKFLNSFATLVTLKHVQKRLSAYKLALDMDAILELDMLTTAFVVTYARLHHGGNGSGFSRNALPENLRPIHDQVIELRNKRFAHSDDHHSVSNELKIEFQDDLVEIKSTLSLGYHIGGRNEWPQLVESIETMLSENIDNLFKRLREKTGRNWALQTGPAPE